MSPKVLCCESKEELFQRGFDSTGSQFRFFMFCTASTSSPAANTIKAIPRNLNALPVHSSAELIDPRCDGNRGYETYSASDYDALP